MASATFAPATSFPTVGQTAFATATVLATTATLAIIGAATATSPIVAIALGILGITSGGAGVASMTAYLDDSSTTAQHYFSNLKKHSGLAIAGIYQLAAQVFVQAFIRGVAEGITQLIRDKITGTSRR